MMSQDFDTDFAAPSDWAAMYRGHGIQIVPAHYPDQRNAAFQWKRPALPEWKELQNQIVPDLTFARWYGPSGEHVMRAQMGILTGPASDNIGVIDLDDQKTAAADFWWRGMLAEHNNSIEPETWEQVTGGGGRQLLFRFPAGFTIPTIKTAIGVDIRGQGGFAVLPPSRHASGKTYDWKQGRGPYEIPIENAPEWLCEAIMALWEEHGGGSLQVGRVKTENSLEVVNDFGRHIDNREGDMTALVWARLIDLYRESPIPPSDKAALEAFEIYERKAGSRLQGPGSNAERLEQEGRGWSAFLSKWRYALKKWHTEIAEEAAKEPLERPEDSPQQIIPAEAPNTGRFTFEKIADLRLLPPTEWLVDKWLPERSIGIFYGKWGAGKSFVGFDLALHVAYGMSDWHGAKLPGVPADVLIVAREGHNGFVKRVDAFMTHHGIIDDAGPITFMRGAVSFMNDQDFSDLCGAIRSSGVAYKLIIIDTVARVTAGEDTNEQNIVTLFMERCQVIGEITGATVVGVHHQNKAGTMMGSIYFEANADFVFEVTRGGEEDSALESGEIRCTKQKDGEDGWKHAIGYKKIVLNQITGEGSLVVSNIGTGSAKPVAGLPDKDVCKRILNAINEAWLKGAPWHPHPNTEKFGRYAVNNIMREFSVKRGHAETLVQDWQRNAVLVVATVNSDTKLKGLKVLQWI